jgi:hypothetical protein
MSGIADPRRVDVDLDLAFHFDADRVTDTDPTFYFEVIIRNYYPVGISQFHCDPLRLHCELSQLPTFHFFADQDLAPKVIRIRIRNPGHDVLLRVTKIAKLLWKH